MVGAFSLELAHFFHSVARELQTHDPTEQQVSPRRVHGPAGDANTHGRNTSTEKWIAKPDLAATILSLAK